MNQQPIPLRRQILKTFVVYLAMVALLLLSGILAGCTTTRYITVPEYHTDTVRITKVQRDSIYLKDSTHVSEKQRGDTLLIEVERWHTRYQDVLQLDTAYIFSRDTVLVPYPVEKRVPAELNWFQQMQLWLGRLVLIALAVLAGWFILKKRAWWLTLLRKII